LCDHCAEAGAAATSALARHADNERMVFVRFAFIEFLAF